MKRFFLFALVATLFAACVTDNPFEEENNNGTNPGQGVLVGTVPNNEIWYTSTDGNIVMPNESFKNQFGGVVSNIYEDGKGVVTFNGEITSISISAFSGIVTLSNIALPNSVTSIGADAFEECNSLESITIPDSVTSIGSSAFYYCTSLTSVTIPNSVTSSGVCAFLGCSSLTSITIPDGVTKIGMSAFDSCTSLTSVTIGNSVTSIGSYAFYCCSSLTSVTIPDSVTEIGAGAFANCESLTAFYGEFASTDNRCLIINGVLNSFAPADLTEYSIPNSVTSIGLSAFEGCTSLTSIAIPNSITSIGVSAFWYCSSLASIYCKPTTPPTGGSSMFDFNASDRKIYVPTASVDAYKAASYWSDYASDIVGYDF